MTDHQPKPWRVASGELPRPADSAFFRARAALPFIALVLLLLTLLPSLDIQAQSDPDPIFADRFSERPDRLNDTGIDWCATNDANNLNCPVATHPGQDGDHGRDALARQGLLPKVGAGHAGFDFTKISNSGNPLPASATLGSGPNQWACTRDNNTGLIWEVKVNNLDHLRHMDHSYTWFNPDPNTNGGNAGTQNGGSCTGSPCDTHGFVQAVSAQGLCGASDWRMPTVRELMSIVHNDRRDPAVDPAWFPNTPPLAWFWSSSSYADDPSGAWAVRFDYGSVLWYFKITSSRVWLVRAGQ